MSIVLITGANRGLGFEFTRQYVSAGWRVFAACRNPATSAALGTLSQEGGGRLAIVAIGVTDTANVQRAAASLQDSRIDVLINCSGILGGPHQTTGDVDYEAWAKILDVNMMGPLRVLEAFAGHVAHSGSWRSPSPSA